MNCRTRRVVFTFCLAVIAQWTSAAEIELIGTAALPGVATDKSGLTDVLEGGIPNSRLGGISAIEYTGRGNRYFLLPDRGPSDGGMNYRCRYHEVELDVQPKSNPAVTISLMRTSLFTREDGKPFVGSLAAFDVDQPTNSLRLDPEGVRLSPQGTLFVSDEYGPVVFEFAHSGTRLRALQVPPRFEIRHSAGSSQEELQRNSIGRQANGGMEGIAITPDGKKLYCSMQRALLQDSAPGTSGKRSGINTRMVEIDLQSGKIRELVYQLEFNSNGVSEILAINDHEFLVLERDGKGGLQAAEKKVFKIDISGATDVSQIDELPVSGLPPGVTPVRKTLFIDFLEPRFGFVSEKSPEKYEGLAFGPTLADGRRLLIVSIDNDFIADRSSLFHAFAIDQASLPNFGW